MTEYDIPWKEVLDVYLRDFLELCLPHVHDGIDWDSPIENHEQELPQLFPNSLTAGRVADKLFRAKFIGSGQTTWFLIHAEVQVSRQAEFAQRMFTCYYRILDRFKEPVVCIGILGDSSKSWRPDTWEFDLLGCQIRFAYPVVKLRDYATNIETFQNSQNPFSTVIASHLRAQASAGSPDIRYRFKVELVRGLYEKHWKAEEVRSLFRFIDWVMDLPEPLELQFRQTLMQIEAEKGMPYVTSIERLAKIEGKIQLLQDLLGLPVMPDAELEGMTAEQLEKLFSELRARLETK